jgi:hypothetical protein
MFHDEAIGSKRQKWKEMSPGQRALTVARWLAIFLAILAIETLIVMLLWNRIMSAVLGLPAFGFWESLGLLILAKVLFGSKASTFMGRMRMRRVIRAQMAAKAEGREGSLD